MIARRELRRRAAGGTVILLLALLVACADGGGDPTPNPAAVIPILHVDVSHPEVIADALAAIREAGVSPEFRETQSVPVEEGGIWAGKNSGWILFACRDEIDRAMAACDKWSEGWKPVEKPAATVPPIAIEEAKELFPARPEFGLTRT